MKATEHFFLRLGYFNIFNDHPSAYGKSYICCAPVPVGGYSQDLVIMDYHRLSSFTFGSMDAIGLELYQHISTY